MYSKRPSFIVGFHGCDESVRDKIVSHLDKMIPSANVYDWLGGGYYFWENNYERALEYAHKKYDDGKIKRPAVLGAYIDLGNCLDLMESRHLRNLKHAYDQLVTSFTLTGQELPVNRADLLKRPLDCAVIEAHAKRQDHQPFDSVRGVFWEGNDLYPGAGMKEKNHIQICIRNINCIKCFFIPRAII